MSTSLRTTNREAFDSAVRKRYANRTAAASPRTSIGAGRKQPEDEKTPLEEFAYGSERIAAGALGAAEGVTDAIGSTFYKGVELAADLAKSTPFYQNWVAKDGDRDETSWLTKLSDFAEKKADDFLDNSVTRDYKESIEKRYRPTEVMKTVGGINELGGQILSSVATGKGLGTLAKAGANALDAVADTSKWARGVNALSAGGNAASQAKAEGADTSRALLYGGMTAAVNQGTERLFGGIPGLGEGKVTKALGGLPGVSKTVDIVGEGVENALGTVIDPFLKRATYNKNAQLATPKEIGQSALLGMATSTAFQLPSVIDDIAAQYTKGLNSIRQKMAMDDLAAVYEKNVGPVEKASDLKEYQDVVEAEKLKNVKKSVEEAGENDNILSGENIDLILKSVADPMADAFGTGVDSNPNEIAAFKKELLSDGVDLIRRAEEALGYSPGLTKGTPGTIYVSDGASYSAWLHEMQHMRDDRDAGWLGMRIFADPDRRYQWEVRAYNVEIELALSLKRPDIADKLKENLEEERRKIYGELLD